jgi:hypothetical protein
LFLGAFDRGDGVPVLLIGSAVRFPERFENVSMRYDDCQNGSNRSADESAESKPLTRGLTLFMDIGLLTCCGMLSRHAIYTCSYRNDRSYYIFMVLLVLAAFGGGFLIFLVCGFFPDAPVPHFDLF